MNTNSIVFIERDDDPKAIESLQAALVHVNMPMIGLVLKVENGELVNWMFADAEFVKSLALILPDSKGS